MELRDKNGLTEAEYLAQYRPNKYPRPSVTVDLCILSRTEAGALRALLIRRGGHPYLGCWALPGGFVSEGETVETAAARELEEETHLHGLSLAPVGVFSAPGRDPRTWTLSCAFAALTEGWTPSAAAGDDAADAQWFDLSFACEGGQARLALCRGNEVLRAEVAVQRQETPFGPTFHCVQTRSEGLAFDHGAILAQALLRLR